MATTKNTNTGKCGHAKCAGGTGCYYTGAPMRTYEAIKQELADRALLEERCARCGERLYTVVRAHHHAENGVDVTA